MRNGAFRRGNGKFGIFLFGGDGKTYTHTHKAAQAKGPL
jgi:hypothetical protein